MNILKFFNAGLINNAKSTPKYHQEINTEKYPKEIATHKIDPATYLTVKNEKLPNILNSNPTIAHPTAQLVSTSKDVSEPLPRKMKLA